MKAAVKAASSLPRALNPSRTNPSLTLPALCSPSEPVPVPRETQPGITCTCSTEVPRSSGRHGEKEACPVEIEPPLVCKAFRLRVDQSSTSCKYRYTPAYTDFLGYCESGTATGSFLPPYCLCILLPSAMARSAISAVKKRVSGGCIPDVYSQRPKCLVC